MFQMFQQAMKEKAQLEESMKDLATQNRSLLLELKATIQLQRELPPQVLLQKPVILHDPLGRSAPFHIEFINSVDALMAVLKVRFEHVGFERVRRLLFELRETNGQKEINIFGPWETAFLVSSSQHLLSFTEYSKPGQQVEMSMLFGAKEGQYLDRCPRCSFVGEGRFYEGQNIQWYDPIFLLQ